MTAEMRCPATCAARDEDKIAPFMLGYPPAAARRYAEAQAGRGGLSRRLARNDRRMDEARRGADVVMRAALLAGFVAKAGGADSKHGGAPTHTAIRKGRWSPADDRCSRVYYAKRGAPWCSRRTGHSIQACRVRAGRLGVSRASRNARAGAIIRGAWDVKEDKYLKANYARLGAAICARKLGRSEAATGRRASTLGIAARHRPWLPDEDRIIRAHFRRGNLPNVAKRLGHKRTESAITTRVAELRRRGYMPPSQKQRRIK